MLEQIDIGTALAIGGIALAVVGWEYRKVLGDRRTENALKEQFQQEIQSLKDEMKNLHEDHQTLLRGRDGEHGEVMRKMTAALDNLNNGIHELTHYIKWVGERDHGIKPPPPLPGTGG